MRPGKVILLLVTAGVPLSPIQAQQPEAVRVPKAVLERYAGEYVYPDGVMTLKISVSGDTLFQETPGRRLA